MGFNSVFKGLIRGIKQRLSNCRECTTYTYKTTDGLIHNLLYTSVGFTVQTADGEMIPARGGVGVEGKVSGAVRATVGNRWE